MSEKIAWTDLGNGLKRRILDYNKDLMMVEVAFEKGAIGALHAHPHTQMTYAISGKFEFAIGAEKKLLEAGGTCLLPSGVEHGCVCLEQGRLLDVFTPCREDFL